LSWLFRLQAKLAKKSSFPFKIFHKNIHKICLKEFSFGNITEKEELGDAVFNLVIVDFPAIFSWGVRDEG
jgi:hypothetical protein